ncbi:hypothetical protein GCM10009119_29940 [Algoriphagus jejuensis]|uniref:DUF2911 family protein n=1 Tax=Algoriphagus jejuensis TaxID=419934 RepID=A0ABN1N2F7_9BACT
MNESTVKTNCPETKVDLIKDLKGFLFNRPINKISKSVMKKKILIGVVAFVVLLGIAFSYLNYRNRNLSPPGTAELTVGGLTVSIAYSRPSVRDRLVFGTEEQGALQPYGTYWRLGANESTEMTVNKDILFNGQPVPAGTYRMYAIPDVDAFEIVLNSELGQWGAFEPNYSLDLLRTKVPVEPTSAMVELYTISMVEREGGIHVVFEWSDVRFSVPIEAQ